jgi:hypothetical protein
MQLAHHQATETAMRAYYRRTAFRADIEAKAAVLSIPKRPALTLVQVQVRSFSAEEFFAAAHEMLAEPPVVDLRGNVRRIQDIVCKFTGAHFADMMSGRHFKDDVYARHLAMYLCKVFTSRSFPDLGRRFNRDHSSILHACKRMKMIEEGAESLGRTRSSDECSKIREDLAKLRQIIGVGNA